MSCTPCEENVEQETPPQPVPNPDTQALVAPSPSSMKPSVIIEFCTRVCGLSCYGQLVALMCPHFVVSMVREESEECNNKFTWFLVKAAQSNLDPN